MPLATDPLPARRYAYLYARAFDGTVINAGAGEGGVLQPGYLQRAYSAVTEVGPEVLLGGVVVHDPTLDELRAQVAALQAQVDTLTATLATTTAAAAQAEQQLAAAQAQVTSLTAALAAERVISADLQAQVTALRATLAAIAALAVGQ